MTNAMLVFLMFCAGAVSAVQPLVNARLAQKVGGVLPSASVSFAVGASVLLVIVSLLGRAADLRGMGQATWWELSGGLIGALYVSATILVYPRIGTAAGMATVITAQLTTGLLLDQFGAFGFRQIVIDWRRLLGVALLLAGAALVYRR